MVNKTTLKDVSKIITKGTTPTTVGGRFVDKGINFIKSESITGSKYLDNKVYEHIDEQTDEKLKRSRLKEGDLLFSIAGAYLGKIGIVRESDLPANTNQAVGIVRLDKSKVNVDYVYYYFSQKNINKYINKLSSQSSQPNLNLELLGNLEFDLRNIDVQGNISKVLSVLDSKIELNNKINAELELMAKTLYDYWFVQFDFPDKNGKPYKTSGGKMVWNEELKRDIPEGWGSILIDQILSKESFTKKIQTSEILLKGVIPVIDQSKDFIAGYTNDVDATIEIKEPRIIFGDHTCILKLINFNFARGADGTQVMVSNNKRMPQYLLYYTLLRIDLSISGYARHYKFLKDQRIILPNGEIVEKFNEVVSRYYELIKKNRFENHALSELRDWLLPMLMNGQVIVN